MKKKFLTVVRDLVDGLDSGTYTLDGQTKPRVEECGCVCHTGNPLHVEIRASLIGGAVTAFLLYFVLRWLEPGMRHPAENAILWSAVWVSNDTAKLWWRKRHHYKNN
jgi:hypothetical protein